MTANETMNVHYPKWIEAERNHQKACAAPDVYKDKAWSRTFDSLLDKKKQGGFTMTPWIMRALTKTGIAELDLPSKTN